MFTYLSNEEKIDCLVNMESYLSKDETIMTKQYEVMEKFLDNVVKECDYTHIRVEKKGNVYTLKWDMDKLSIEYCDELLEEFRAHTVSYKRIFRALHEDYKKTIAIDFQLGAMKLDYLYNFQTYLVDSWYDYTPEEMVKFCNNRHNMDIHRNYRNHGLSHTSMDDYDEDLAIERLIKRKDKIKYTEDDIDNVDYLELAETKIYERELELERDLKVHTNEHPSAYYLVMEDMKDFSRDKKILEEGIKLLEVNNFVVDTNPFKYMSHEFKEEFIENYVKHFNKIGRPEFQQWIFG